jgi:hypothetical protein
MLVGYAFWGLSSLMFNVRESKRVFSIVGAGDIPAKMIGYLSVSILVKFIGAVNLLWISIIAFLAALTYIRYIGDDIKKASHHVHHLHEHHTKHHKHHLSFIDVMRRLFQSKLVFFIALSSLITYIVFAFVDFTFLVEIKAKYKKLHDLAAFIAYFLTAGQLFAIIIKVLFSSRVIARIGVVNALLISPLLILATNTLIVLTGGPAGSYLYIFGAMFVIMEVLRTTIQEPVFFILFQPLSPHERLRGHLIAKGYTLPFALLSVGAFFMFYQQTHSAISIPEISKLLIVLLILWIGTVILVRNEYIRTLINSIKKGFFTGSELFLNNDDVFNILIERTKSKRPLEVIHALNLLERSEFKDINKLLLQFLLDTNSKEIKDYVLGRIISNKITSALPIIKNQLNIYGNSEESIIKAYFFLEDVSAEHTPFLNSLHGESKKAALIGLLLKKDDAAVLMAKHQLIRLARSKDLKNNKSAVEVISQVGGGNFNEVLQVLLENENKEVYCPTIEVTGRVKDFSLFPKLIDVTIEKQSYYALDKALVNYGDDVFEEKYLSPENLPEKILHHIIKSASKVKGEKSDTFLMTLLKKYDKHQEDIIESLWMKKASLVKKEELEKWINTSLTHLKSKVNCFLSLHQNNQANLLENALFSEIEQNVETILKACAIVYNKEEINRFIEVYKLDDHSKVANAMELLEMTIPKKYFNPLSQQIEISHDIKNNQKLLHRRKKMETEGVVKEVITDSHTSFNSWSKSVAIYLLPTLYNKDAVLKLVTKKRKDDDAIVKETTDYVLSVLK